MKGIVFGVFDGLHDGHKYFLNSARAQCNALVVAVAPDEVVMEIKKKNPHQSLTVRMTAIQSWDSSLTVVAGDREVGSWEVLEKEKPDVVFIGYDQDAIAERLAKSGMRIEMIPAHEPTRFKSSLMNTDGV